MRDTRTIAELIRVGAHEVEVTVAGTRLVPAAGGAACCSSSSCCCCKLKQ